MISAADLLQIFHISPIPIAILDVDLKLLAVSNQWLKTYGMERAQVIGQSYCTIFPERSREWLTILEQAVRGKDQSGEDQINEPSSLNNRWMKWEVKAWKSQHGNVGGVIIYSEDITLHKQSTFQDQQFRLFMDYLPGLCWITNEENVLTYANNDFFETLHLPKDVVGKNNEEIFGSDVAKNAHINNMEVLRTQQSKELFQTIRGQDGYPQYFKTYKFPFMDASGKQNLVGAVSFDITKHKQLEENLYQSEEQFRQAFEHSLIGMALISPEGRWKRVNSSLCDILGYCEEELQQLYIQDITHPEDLHRSSESLKELADGIRENVKMEKRYIHKDGSVIWVVIAATMLKDSLGHPLHYVSQIEDITKRKEIEGNLLLSEKKYRTIFENVQDVFYQADQQGRVTEISPSILQYSGYTREEIIGRPVIDFYYYPHDRDRIIESLQKDGFVIDFEARLKTINQELRYASVNARLIRENGLVVGTEGSMRDITARKSQDNALKALNTELTASNEQKNKLLSIIGHDLRNPISGSLQLLDLTLNDFQSSSAEEVHTYLSMMKQELSSANELLEDLLTWAKSQFNAVSFNPVNIEDLAAQLQKCLLSILPMAEKKGIRVLQSVEPDLELSADKAMLDTIIRNLVSNAVKFSYKNGEILIKAIKNDTGVQFSVSDSGIGIPKDKVQELFNSKSNYTTFGTLGEKGTGLGLNLVSDFVAKHGGEIWLESEEGKGTTFYFTIPAGIGTFKENEEEE
ncbi:PAS domain S-box protein [Pedobacter nutrimenti]|uniref:PAS domain S-box protein n=1 Tax=Pedobacter nutrimenti TaxID=1241337 RepID=UPI00292CB4BE|nr:PAS domain S-box protein [Pedobacter nutrimenti]